MSQTTFRTPRTQDHATRGTRRDKDDTSRPHVSDLRASTHFVVEMVELNGNAPDEDLYDDLELDADPTDIFFEPQVPTLGILPFSDDRRGRALNLARRYDDASTDPLILRGHGPDFHVYEKNRRHECERGLELGADQSDFGLSVTSDHGRVVDAGGTLAAKVFTSSRMPSSRSPRARPRVFAGSRYLR